MNDNRYSFADNVTMEELQATAINVTLWDHVQLLGYVTFAFRMFKVYFLETRNKD